MKMAIKVRRFLSWNTLGVKHEEFCEKLGIYLEAKKKNDPTGSGLAPWRSRPEKIPIDRTNHFW